MRTEAALKALAAVSACGTVIALCLQFWTAPSPRRVVFSTAPASDEGDGHLGPAPVWRWEACDGERELARFSVLSGTRLTIVYILGADLYESSGKGPSFPAFFEPANGTCPPGLHQALSVHPSQCGPVEVSLRRPGEDWSPWSRCIVTSKWLTNVVSCPGILVDGRPPPCDSANCSLALRFRDAGSLSLDPSQEIRFCTKRRQTIAPLRNMTVCVAFGDRQARPRLLAEYVEYHRMQGVDRVVLYDRTTSEENYTDIAKRLGYIDSGVVVVRRWPGLTWNPQNVEDCARFYDKPSALMHCLWHERGKSRFVLTADIDEWIFDSGSLINTSVRPRLVESISEALERDPRQACAVLPKLDFGGGAYDDRSLVIEQFTHLAESQPNQYKSVCVPERQWGTTVHNGLPAPGFVVGKAVNITFKNTIALAHYANLFSTREPPSVSEFSLISERWASALKAAVCVTGVP